jgi:phosphatidylserine/phosphatidylglycerophosphate/cardiolipin synthase-like enzyme
MNKKQLVANLQATLEDYRMTRGERRALKESVAGHSQSDRDSLRHEAFELARSELTNPQAVEVTRWLEAVVKLLVLEPSSSDVKSEAFFSPADNCVAKLVALLMLARSSIDICVFTITDDRIASAILDAHRRKIAIRIITDDKKAEDLGSDVFHLMEMGIPVRTDKNPDHMHHKYALFDRQRLLTGSYNWTRSAALRNEENFIVTNETNLVDQFAAHFDRLWGKYQSR